MLSIQSFTPSLSQCMSSQEKKCWVLFDVSWNDRLLLCGLRPNKQQGWNGFAAISKLLYIFRIIPFPWLFSTAAPWLLHCLKLLNKKMTEFLNEETGFLRFFVVLLHRSLSVLQRIAMATMHGLCLALVCMVCPHFHLKGLFAFTISPLNPLQPVIHISHGSFSLSLAVFTLYFYFTLPLIIHGEVLIPILKVSDPYWKVCGASHSICPVGNTGRESLKKRERENNLLKNE